MGKGKKIRKLSFARKFSCSIGLYLGSKSKKKKITVKGDFLSLFEKYKIVVQGMQNQFLMLKLGWQTLWKGKQKNI